MFGLTPDTIKVTDEAIGYFKKCMKLDSDSIGIRLKIINGSGCGGNEYDMDFIHEASDDDDLLELGEDIKLYIPKMDVLKLFGSEIDFKSDAMGNQRIHITNPNEKSQCGCGLSINFEE